MAPDYQGLHELMELLNTESPEYKKAISLEIPMPLFQYVYEAHAQIGEELVEEHGLFNLHGPTFVETQARLQRTALFRTATEMFRQLKWRNPTYNALIVPALIRIHALGLLIGDVQRVLLREMKAPWAFRMPPYLRPEILVDQQSYVLRGISEYLLSAASRAPMHPTEVRFDAAGLQREIYRLRVMKSRLVVVEGVKGDEGDEGEDNHDAMKEKNKPCPQ